MDSYGELFYQAYELTEETRSKTFSAGPGSQDLKRDELTTNVSKTWVQNLKIQAEVLSRVSHHTEDNLSDFRPFFDISKNQVPSKLMCAVCHPDTSELCPLDENLVHDRCSNCLQTLRNGQEMIKAGQRVVDFGACADLGELTPKEDIQVEDSLSQILLKLWDEDSPDLLPVLKERDAEIREKRSHKHSDKSTNKLIPSKGQGQHGDIDSVCSNNEQSDSVADEERNHSDQGTHVRQLYDKDVMEFKEPKARSSKKLRQSSAKPLNLSPCKMSSAQKGQRSGVHYETQDTLLNSSSESLNDDLLSDSMLSTDDSESLNSSKHAEDTDKRQVISSPSKVSEKSSYTKLVKKRKRHSSESSIASSSSQMSKLSEMSAGFFATPKKLKNLGQASSIVLSPDKALECDHVNEEDYFSDSQKSSFKMFSPVKSPLHSMSLSLGGRGSALGGTVTKKVTSAKHSIRKSGKHISGF